MKIIAHRGVSAHFHENTFLAFQKAIEFGADGIELDIQQVGDEFFVFHDFYLNRLTPLEGDLIDLSPTQLGSLRLNNSEKLPTLDEVFDLVKGATMLNLELKSVHNTELLVEKLTSYLYRYPSEVVVSSFNHFLLREFKKSLRDTRFSKMIQIGALIAHLPIDLGKYAVELEADIAAIDAYLVSKEFVEYAHIHNLEVWCYTVNFDSGFFRLKEMGVDAIFTNDPVLMKELC